MILHPKFSYCGLTIILDNPSRFDVQRKSLLCGFAGDWFAEECLQPEINRWQCEIRTREEKSSLRADTKVILALGNRVINDWFGNKFTLGEQRGSPYMHNGVPVISSYLPQDCMDPRDHEGNLNPLAFKYDEDDKDDEEDAGKTHGRTSRTNFKFWLQKDTKKAIRILRDSGRFTRRVVGTGECKFTYYPEINKVIAELNATSNRHLYLDIETDYSHNLLCVGYGFCPSSITVVPVFRYNSGLAYATAQLCQFLRALSLAMIRNIVVAHNGYGFDYIVMADKYKLLLGKRYYDTMIGQHRCYPEVEKSLGHCISLWTDEPYHKAEGVIPPHSREQEEQLWSYNAKDVATMMLVHKYQMEYAATVPGLVASIEQGCSSIYPYMVTSLQGLLYDDVKLQAKIAYNDRVMTQYLRCMKLLVGRDFLPTSNKQCPAYFHDTLGYPVVQRSKIGNPKLGEKELQKLKLKFPNNAVIDFSLAYRALKTETGSLGYKPWRI